MMATRDTLHVEVLTAERGLYSGEAEIVDAPGSEGQLGILPRHAPLLTLLGAGALRIKLRGAEEILFVSGGFLEVSNNRVTVLADTAEHADEIDQARAEEARRQARESLSASQTRSEIAEQRARLERAINRIKVVEIARTSTRRIIEPRSDEEE
jgi:F-type H+-transporting ATPase subunit epsilon